MPPGVLAKVRVRLDMLDIIRVHNISLLFLLHVVSLFDVDQLEHLAAAVAPVHGPLLQFEPNHGVVVVVVVEVPDTPYVLVRHAVGEDEGGVVDGAEVAREYLEGLEVDQRLGRCHLVCLLFVCSVAEEVRCWHVLYGLHAC